MPWLRDPSNGGAQYRSPAEDDPNPRARAIHALQGLLTTEREPIQAQPSGRAEVDENIRVQSAVDIVARRVLMPTHFFIPVVAGSVPARVPTSIRNERGPRGPQDGLAAAAFAFS
jgi:hypothetical protein